MTRADEIRAWVAALVADAGAVPVEDLEAALARTWGLRHRAAFRHVRKATSWPDGVIAIRRGVAVPAPAAATAAREAGP